MNKAIAVALMLGMSSQATVAVAADPASDTVQSLQNGLLAIMKAGASAGLSGRERLILPVIDRTFDIPLMTRLAVGPSWTSIDAPDQAKLVSAFRDMTIAEYAWNFDGYSGERFTIAAQVLTRGSDKLVRTTLVSPGGDPESLNYRLRKIDGQWKIIDVYYRNSISQLATRRSDFATVLKKGGAKALISHLERLAAKPG
jgi:phospholipid transport system substrate-binding protein